MANIALNKFPIEKDLWSRPELATNGNIIDYDGQNGFAHSRLPSKYTIEFEEEKIVESIRFLLWDGLGKRAEKPNSRKYRFSLSISKDGKNFIQLYSNQNQEGSNGWHTFEFLNVTTAKFIRLDCISNTANSSFHLVEFEVHDSLPVDIVSNNHHKHVLNSGFPAYDDLKQQVELAITEKTNAINELNEELIKKIDSFNREEARLKNALKEVGLLTETKSFSEEAVSNSKKSSKWFKYAVFLIIFISLIILYFGWFDCKAFKIIMHGKQNNFSDSHITILLSFFYFAKAVVISTLLFSLGWVLKNYRAEKHNYTINRHKFISLSTANNIMVNPEYKDVDKKLVFIEVLKNVFSHQNTGYSKEESNNPNIINTLLTKNNPSD
jgi:hypothetical protein